MMLHAEQGNVIYDSELDCKYVMRRSRLLASHEQLFAVSAHEDGDYSYRCGEADCVCAASGSGVAKGVGALMEHTSATRNPRDAMWDVMAMRVRDRTGCRLADCQIAVKLARSIDGAVEWLSDKTLLVPLHR